MLAILPGGNQLSARHNIWTSSLLDRVRSSRHGWPSILEVNNGAEADSRTRTATLPTVLHASRRAPEDDLTQRFPERYSNMALSVLPVSETIH